jgi:hypothetical protein
VIYWVLPGAFMLAFVALYFSGVRPLQELIAPRSNREFGFLETVQVVLLFGVGWAGASGFRIAATGFGRAIFAGITLCALVMILEEIDYGWHYYGLITGQPTNDRFYNIHNIGGTTDLFKLALNIWMVVFCVLLPLAKPRITLPWLRPFVPSRLILSTVALRFLISELAHFLHNSGWYPRGPLTGNISEFGECISYYLILLYVLELKTALAAASMRTDLAERRAH